MTTSWIFITPHTPKVSNLGILLPIPSSLPLSYLFGFGRSDILWLFRFSPMSQHAHMTTLSARDTWGHLGLTGVWIHNLAEHLHKPLGLDARQACEGLALSLMPILPTFPVPGSSFLLQPLPPSDQPSPAPSRAAVLSQALLRRAWES